MGAKLKGSNQINKKQNQHTHCYGGGIDRDLVVGIHTKLYFFCYVSVQGEPNITDCHLYVGRQNLADKLSNIPDNCISLYLQCPVQ